MRIATYNIQHGISHKQRIVDGSNTIDMPLIIETIRGLEPDICGLNEVFGDGAYPLYFNQPKFIGDALGYENVFAMAVDFEGDFTPPRKPYGNGLVSKYPIKSTEVILIPKGNDDNEPGYKEPRCILKAVVDCEGKELCVMVIHVGLVQQEQTWAMEKLCKVIDETDLPIVIVGDFNMTPENEFLAPVRERLFDTAELIKEDLRSYPSDRPEIKIDYIFTRGLKVTYADIPQICAADHCPYIAEIEF